MYFIHTVTGFAQIPSCASRARLLERKDIINLSRSAPCCRRRHRQDVCRIMSIRSQRQCMYVLPIYNFRRLPTAGCSSAELLRLTLSTRLFKSRELLSLDDATTGSRGFCSRCLFERSSNSADMLFVFLKLYMVDKPDSTRK